MVIKRFMSIKELTSHVVKIEFYRQYYTGRYKQFSMFIGSHSEVLIELQ